MIFNASMDQQAKWLTAVVMLINAIAIGALLFMDISQFGLMVGAVLLVVAFTISWGYSTNQYILSGDKIIIKRPFGNKTIPVSTISKAEKIDRANLRYSARTFGNGGFMGYYGSYYNKKLGKMQWYATNLNNAILLTTKTSKKIIITPDEHQKFLHQIAPFIQKI